MPTDNPIASDNLPARRSGAWAEEKLQYVQFYLEIVAKAMSKKWNGLAYLDLMAGPGRCLVPESGREFDGSPLIARAVAPRYNRIVLIEQSPVLFEALGTRMDRLGEDTRVELLPGDCNDRAVLDAAVRLLPPDALTIVFVDNLGLDVPFATLEYLAGRLKTDFLITFQRSDLQRNWENSKGNSTSAAAHAARFDAFFGSDVWRDVVNQGTARSVPTRLEELYRKRLTTFGHSHITSSPTVMKNSVNRELYHLLLASRHERAVDLFDKVARYTPAAKNRGALFDDWY